MSGQEGTFSSHTGGPTRLEEVVARVVRLEAAFKNILSQHALLQALASTTVPADNAEFFHAMVFHVSAALGVKAALITEFVDDTRSRHRLLAGIVHGEFLREHWEHELPDALGSLVSSEVPIFLCPTEARSRFTNAVLVKDLDVEGACWVAVLGTAERMLGILLLLHERPLHLTAEAQALLRLFAARAGTEFERRRTDAARQESETRFSASMHHLPGVVFIKDQQGRHLYVNRAFEELFGLTRDDWYCKTNEQLFPPSVAQVMSVHDRAVLHEGNPIHIVENTAQKGGSRTWLVTKFPLRLHENASPMLAGIALDVSSYHQTLHSLREQEDRYRRLVDVCPDAIVIQREGRIVFVNAAAMALFGADTPVQLLGRSLFELFHPNDAPILAERMRRSLDCGENLPLLEERIVRLDGAGSEVEVTAAPFADGNAQAIQVVLRNSSHRKGADHVIRTFARERQKLLDERHRLCVNLHDSLLQHLYALGLSLEACQAHMPRTSAELKIVFSHTIKQLSNIINEVRQFLGDLSVEPWSKGNLAGHLRELVRSVAHLHATRLRTTMDEAAADGLSSRQCAQIFVLVKEALSNSLRHARATRITLSLRRIKGGIRLSVQDNGVGFDLHAVKGRGQGLANMESRAQEIGGQLCVSSKLNCGTRIILTIPEAVSVIGESGFRSIVRAFTRGRRAHRARKRSVRSDK